LTRKVYLRNTRILVGTVFVDNLEIVTLARRCGETVLGDMDIDFFSSVDTRVGKRSRGSSIFPFDVRSTIEIDFSLYSSQSSLRNSVTPVRRREDTEGDGDAGVKVQIGCPLGVSSRIPFELLRNNSKGETRKDSLLEEKSFSRGVRIRLKIR
jgi:hypothetical protein